VNDPAPLVIVGGGAAGIGAAIEAGARGITPLILEAGNRLGGRAHSVVANGVTVDLGAGWLHSANRNRLVPLAEERGLEIDRSPTPWRGQFRALGFSRDDQAAAYEAFAMFEETVANPQPGDVAASALPPGGEWNAFVDALSGYLNGTSLQCMSAADYAAYSSAANECNWRLPSGYGALIAGLGQGLDVRFGFAVDSIARDAKHVRLSAGDETIIAERAIVTVSSNVLASGAIRFFPAVDDHLHAASHLPLGHVEKAFFTLDDAEDFPNDAHLVGDPRRTDTGSYMLRPMGLPVVEAFFGGNWVADAAAADLNALAERELAALLGTDFTRRIRPLVQSAWKNDRRFGGSYSFAMPGHHGDRALLARPADERLAFAGEASSLVDFSTVHGAFESGKAAVRALLD